MAIPTSGCNPCTPTNCTNCYVPGTGQGFTTNPVNRTYSVGDIINIHCNEGYRIYDLLCNDYDVSYFATMLFDRITAPDGSGIDNLVPKNLPGVQQTLTNDGLGIQWGEREQLLDEATITTTDTATNVIEVSRTDFVLVGEIVRILTCDPDGECCQNETIRKVTAIDVLNSTITVDGAPLDVFQDVPTSDCSNKIIRLYETYNLCDSVVGRQVLDVITDKESYFQHIGELISFKRDEINICYATPNEAIGYVENIFMTARRRITRSMQNAFWFGRNKRVAANIVGDGPETMWVITGILDAEARCGVTLTRDLSCLTTQDEKLAGFMDEIRKASLCGVGNRGYINVVGNAKAIQGVMMMQSAWNRLLGCIPTCPNPTSKEFYNFEIKTPFGSTVRFFMDSVLTYQYQNQSIMVIIPDEWVGMYTYANTMNSQGQVVKQNSSVFTWEDISYLNRDKFDCGYNFKITGTFLYQLVGLCTGKRRVVYGIC